MDNIFTLITESPMIESLKHLDLACNWISVDLQLAENFVNLIKESSLERVNMNYTHFHVSFTGSSP